MKKGKFHSNNFNDFEDNTVRNQLCAFITNRRGSYDTKVKVKVMMLKNNALNTK